MLIFSPAPPPFIIPPLISSVRPGLHSYSNLHLSHFPSHPLHPPSSSLCSSTTFSRSSPAVAPHPPPPFPLLHSRHSELFSMSSFIAGARSQLQLITERRAGGTRSAFRSALSLHFAINPFHTRHPPTPPTPHLHTLAHSISPPVFILSPLYLRLSATLPLRSSPFPLKSLLELCLSVRRL